MGMGRMNRIELFVSLCGVGLCSLGQTPGVAAQEVPSRVDLAPVPTTVYRVPDVKFGNLEGWYFNVVVDDGDPAQSLLLVSGEVELRSQGSTVQRTGYSAAGLDALRGQRYTVAEDAPPTSLRRPIERPEDFDLRFWFPGLPTAWNVDTVRVSLVLDDALGRRTQQTVDVPVQEYAQRTSLIFPLPGRSIVTQGPIHDGGHSGHATHFAIDVMGLGPEYGPMSNEGDGNAQFAGWRRSVVAPAAGRVAYARNDVPDNAPGSDPIETYGRVPDPLLAVAGNAVVIDHENGEFSVLMHMAEGSVSVSAGDRVAQGQVIGQLGNSGDSFAAHLHYQLQDGVELFNAHSLPVAFSNLEGVTLARGEFLTVPGS